MLTSYISFFENPVYEYQTHQSNNQINKISLAPKYWADREQRRANHSLAWSYVIIQAQTGSSTGSQATKELGSNK